MHTLTRTFLRPLGVDAAKLPAFHAAYLMLAVIMAAMLPLGFFAFLVAARIAVEYHKYRRVQVLRSNLSNITLLMCGLTASVTLSTFPLVKGLAMFLPKLIILHHIVRKV